MRKANATYIDRERPLKRSFAPRIPLTISLVLAFVFFMLGVQAAIPALVNSGSTVAYAQDEEIKQNAFGFLCGDKNSTGIGMGKADWKLFMKYYPSPEAGGRTWTLQEAVGAGLKFSGYTGEGNEGWLINNVGKKRGEKQYPKFAEAMTKLTEPRNVPNCMFSPAPLIVADGTLQMASAISSFAQTISVIAFDSELICKDPANPTGNCFNIAKIIGGVGGSEEGIIGALTSSIYMPLLVIVAAVTGFWVAWIGLAKRKFREALFGVIWVVASVILGLALLLNPNLLAKAPMVVSNSVATCIIGAFNGDNCMTTDTGNNPTTTGAFSEAEICKSSANVSLDEQMSMTINGLTCSIWKAFILEPYSQGQWGKNFDALFVDKPEIKAAIDKAGLDPREFCVSLKSAESVNQQGQYIKLNQSGNEVCNLAAYQLYLQTKAEGSPPGVATRDDGGTMLDENWYRLVLVAANDSTLWDSWALSPSAGMNKISIAGVAAITSGFGSAVIVLIAFFAVIYYLTSVIMMAFAPVFFLIGVHPGRGKKIFVGWLELVISNVLKYIASALFLVLTIALYGSVLSNIDNIGLTLVFVLMLTGALFMYRKEIVELIGRVNMGGEQLSNKFSKSVDRLTTRAKRNVKATVGGTLGAAASAGVTSPREYFSRMGEEFGGEGNIMQRTGRAAAAGVSTIASDAAKVSKAGATGAADGFMRDAKRGSGVIAEAFRTSSRMHQDNRRDVDSRARRTGLEARELGRQVEGKDRDIADAKSEVVGQEETLRTQEADHVKGVAEETLAERAEDKLVVKFQGENAVFADLQATLNNISRLELARDLAAARGDTAAVESLNKEILLETGREHDLRRQLVQNYDSEEIERLQGAYNDSLAKDLGHTSVEEMNKERAENRENIIDFEGLKTEYFNNVEDYNKLVSERNEMNQEHARLKETAAHLEDAREALRPGQGFTDRDVAKLHNEASAAGETAANSSINIDLHSAASFADVPIDIPDRGRTPGAADDHGLPPAPPSGLPPGPRGPNSPGEPPASPPPTGPVGSNIGGDRGSPSPSSSTTSDDTTSLSGWSSTSTPTSNPSAERQQSRTSSHSAESRPAPAQTRSESKPEVVTESVVHHEPEGRGQPSNDPPRSRAAETAVQSEVISERTAPRPTSRPRGVPTERPAGPPPAGESRKTFDEIIQGMPRSYIDEVLNKAESEYGTQRKNASSEEDYAALRKREHQIRKLRDELNKRSGDK